MKESLFYFLALIIISMLIFMITASSVGGSTSPVTDVLLSLILSHLIIPKNQGITSYFKERYSKEKP